MRIAIPDIMTAQKSSNTEEEDLKFQKKEWVFQRVVWMIMLVIVVLAVIGVFGNGPIAKAEAGNPQDLLHIKYDRIVRERAQTGSLVTINLNRSAILRQTGDTLIHLWISQDWVHSMGLTSTTPYPARTSLNDSAIVFSFVAPYDSKSIKILFNWKPVEVGLQHGYIGLLLHPNIYELSTFVLP